MIAIKVLLISLAAGAADARTLRSIVSGHEFPPKHGQNPACLTDTGKTCADGCPPYTECKNGRCMCPHWGCSDEVGTCRPAFARWLEVEHRIAPARTPNFYMGMQPNNSSAPVLTEGWPESNHPTGIWLFLEQNSNKSALIATKQGRYVTDLHFLDLPPPPWNASGFEAPLQRTIDHAGQAEWMFESADDHHASGARRIKHLASGRYLCVTNHKSGIINQKIVPPPEEIQPELSSCAPQSCEPFSTEFHIWPKNEHLLHDVAM